jgi:hypothetical protein
MIGKAAANIHLQRKDYVQRMSEPWKNIFLSSNKEPFATIYKYNKQ